jgi:hypothetical protein
MRQYPRQSGFFWPILVSEFVCPGSKGIDRTGVTGTLHNSTTTVVIPTQGTIALSGRVRRVVIKAAIGGAVTAEWNLSRDGLSTPTTTVSASGETWTYVGAPTFGED